MQVLYKSYASKIILLIVSLDIVWHTICLQVVTIFGMCLNKEINLGLMVKFIYLVSGTSTLISFKTWETNKFMN